MSTKSLPPNRLVEGLVEDTVSVIHRVFGGG
jgi:hypothetical protein